MANSVKFSQHQLLQFAIKYLSCLGERITYIFRVTEAIKCQHLQVLFFQIGFSPPRLTALFPVFPPMLKDSHDFVIKQCSQYIQVILTIETYYPKPHDGLQKAQQSPLEKHFSKHSTTTAEIDGRLKLLNEKRWELGRGFRIKIRVTISKTSKIWEQRNRHRPYKGIFKSNSEMEKSWTGR